MDGLRFDTLVRTLSVTGSRRRLLGVFASAPLLSAVHDLLDPADAEAKERRRRRKQRHKRRKNPGSRKGKGCTPRSRAQVCNGRCGLITNRDTCGKTVDCGSCDCNPPCGECLTCKSGPNTVGSCVPDSAQDGDACDDGELCTTGSVCSAGVCGGGTPVVCPATDCQDPGVCDPATGACSAAVDKPAGTTCPSQPCGACNGAGTCVANAACSGGTPVCLGGECVECATSDDCDTGLVCDAIGHFCRSCQHIGECVKVIVGGSITCEALWDGSGERRCLKMQDAICPGTCSDCPEDYGCTFTGGGGCFGKNLCAPLSPAL